MEKIKRDFTIIFIINFVLLGLLFLQNNWLRINRYDILSSTLPEKFNDYKIVQVSDLHSKEFEESSLSLLNKIREINPDIVVITGDMLNSTNDDGRSYLKLAEGLIDEYQIVYYAEEDSVQTAQSLNDYIDKLNKIGVKVLDNDKIEINKNLFIPLKYYSGKGSARYADKIGTRLFNRPEITVITIKNS